MHDVLVDLPGRDGVRDFLAQDGDLLRVYESQGLDSPVADQSPESVLTLESEDRSQASYTLTTPATAGFVYIQQPDPFGGSKTIARVTRSDGKQLPSENAWSSKVRQEDTSWVYSVDFFDVGTTGRYTVVFDDAPSPTNRKPVLQFIADATTEEGQQMAFLVEASDPDGTTPTLNAAPLPAGARFVDRGNGEGVFDWTPVDGQEGTYEVSFTASDGALSTSQLVVLTVDPSTTTTPVDYLIELHEGFNLFAYPIQVAAEHASCQGLLTAIGSVDEIESIGRYDTPNGLYERCSYEAGGDFAIYAGEAYVVRMKTRRDVLFSGDQACPALFLPAGVNLIGHPAPQAGLSCFDLLEAAGEGFAVSIQRFDPINGAFETCTWFDGGEGPQRAGTDFPIVVGEGLLVNMEQGLFLTLPGCGD